MIVRMSEIYKEVAEENDWSKAVVESVGVEVLSCLRDKLNGPDEIAYELPKLGTFTLKQKKYEGFHNYLLGALEEGRYILGENYSEEMYSKNLILMDKINKFRSDKLEKKQLKDEAKTKQPSQDISEEH